MWCSRRSAIGDSAENRASKVGLSQVTASDRYSASRTLVGELKFSTRLLDAAEPKVWANSSEVVRSSSLSSGWFQ